MTNRNLNTWESKSKKFKNEFEQEGYLKDASVSYFRLQSPPYYCSSYIWMDPALKLHPSLKALSLETQILH